MPSATSLSRALTLGLALVLLGVPGAGPDALVHAEESAEARTPAEIFERKPTIEECVVYVAKDLRTRYLAIPEAKRKPAVLLLAIDPTSSLKNEIEALRKCLQLAWVEGPRGLRIGVYGIDADEYVKPDRLPRKADGSLSALTVLPADGAKNLHAGIREAADLLADEKKTGPKAMLLITQEGGEASDDVEKTRDALFDADCAFYCIAGEAAFERCWQQTYQPRGELFNSGLAERYHPQPRRKKKGEVFYSGETALGLVPYRWEFDLAQSEYFWVRPPLYPVPSGFGYWPLATLCYSTGGRYFIFDFPSTGLTKRQNNRRMSLYEYSRMALVAPDLRPRNKILKALNKDWRAQAIVRIWQSLADEKLPVIQTLGTLERKGNTIAMRPTRPVRSQAAPRQWYEEMGHVLEAKQSIKKRIKVVDEAIGWWRTANAKERTGTPGEDPLKERIEANFQLLGLNLMKVQFQLHEAVAALETIKQLDVTYRRSRILPSVLMYGINLPKRRIDLGTKERNKRFAEVVLAQKRLAEKYAGTPWELSLKKGNLKTFRKDVRIIEQPGERPTRPEPKPGKGDKNKPKPPPKPTPPPRPADGPRPGSGSGGPVTGGG